MKTSGRIGLFYVLTFVFFIILAVAQQVMGIGFERITLPQFAPGLAAFVMLVVFRKDNVKFTITVTRTQTLKYIGAIAIPLLGWTIIFLIYHQFIDQISIQPFSGIAGLLLGAFAEELGWRGYLQNILENKVNVLIASLLVGVLWGLWHVSHYQQGPVYMLFFILSVIAYSVFIAWLILDTSYNVIIAWLFHSTFNTGFFVIGWDIFHDLRFMMLNGIVWVVAASVLVVLKRKVFFARPIENIGG